MRETTILALTKLGTRVEELKCDYLKGFAAGVDAVTEKNEIERPLILSTRETCPMRHSSGNCLPAGGFCTAVSDPICEALHNAYSHGASDLMSEPYFKILLEKGDE